MGHDEECGGIGSRSRPGGFTGRGNAGQHFGAQNLIGGIALTVFHGPFIARREEEHLLLSHELSEVVIEIAGLIGFVKDKENDACQTVG